MSTSIFHLFFVRSPLRPSPPPYLDAATRLKSRQSRVQALLIPPEQGLGHRRSKAVLLIQVEGAEKVNPRDLARSRVISPDPNGLGGARVRVSWRTSQDRGFAAPTRYSKRGKPSHLHPGIGLYSVFG